MAYILMAFSNDTNLPYIVMAYIVMAYIVMAFSNDTKLSWAQRIDMQNRHACRHSYRQSWPVVTPVVMVYVGMAYILVGYNYGTRIGMCIGIRLERAARRPAALTDAVITVLARLYPCVRHAVGDADDRRRPRWIWH